MQAADATYAIRSGDWKFVERVDAPKFEHRNRNAEAKANRKNKTAPARDELFDLKMDPQEEKNVVDASRDVAGKMKRNLDEARTRGYTRSEAGA